MCNDVDARGISRSKRGQNWLGQEQKGLDGDKRLALTSARSERQSGARDRDGSENFSAPPYIGRTPEHR